MKDKIKAYVEGIFSDVPNSPKAQAVKEGITESVIKKYTELLSEGKTEEEAYALAITRAGDISLAASELRNENNTQKPADNFASTYDKKAANKKIGQFSGVLWPLIVIVYLAYSFTFMAWHYSWIIFLIGSAAQNLYTFFQKSGKASRAAMSGFIWLSITTVYFIISFFTMRWDVTWMIFLIGVAVHNLIRALMFGNDLEEE